uniref:CCHC-type domain-containing protein n=1 Tax=Xenopus tropicalis TaxID=8364 RepID=A0A803J891_XENTR
MEGFNKKLATVKNTEELIRCMQEADDPWYQIKDFVTVAIKEKQLSQKKGRRALLFSACWIAENFKALKEKNCFLEEKVKDLNDKIEMLKITASNASTMSMGHYKTTQENEMLQKENGELLSRLKDAEGAIRYLSVSRNHGSSDHSKCQAQILELKEQLGQRGAIVAAFNTPGTDQSLIDINWDLLEPSQQNTSLNNCASAPMAPVTVHIKTGTDGEEVGRTRVETPLSNSDIGTLSKELGLIRISDDPVETMLRIQTFQKSHVDCEDGDVFDVVVSSLDQGIKASIPGSVYKTHLLDVLVNAVLEVLGWDESYAHNAFVNCLQKKGEPIQAFSDRLYAMYSFTVQRPGRADLEDRVFKNALIKQSLPEICRLVGLTVSLSNTYGEIINCLKRAELMVREQQRSSRGKVAAVEGPLTKPYNSARPPNYKSGEPKCHSCGHLGHIIKNCPFLKANAMPAQSSISNEQLLQELVNMRKDIDKLRVVSITEQITTSSA